MPEGFRIAFTLDPIPSQPASPWRFKTEFRVAMIYSNIASPWYVHADHDDPFLFLPEIGRIEAQKYFKFDMVQKEVSHRFFREAYARKSRFDIRFKYLITQAHAGKTTIIKNEGIDYHGAVLSSYKTEFSFEYGLIAFESQTEVKLKLLPSIFDGLGQGR